MSWSGDWNDVEVPHSISFGNKNTYVDWHLIPESRPVIAMPPMKKTVVDIPGGNGSIDLSEALTHYPVYDKRTGSVKFHVLNGYNWVDIYEDMAASLQGRQVSMILADDPYWYYTGRYEIVWTSNNDGSWSDVEINYDLEPLKYSINVDSISFTATSTYRDYQPMHNMRSMPVNPWITITGHSGATPILTIDQTNPELDISYGDNKVEMSASNVEDLPLYSIILSNMDGGSNNLSTDINDRQVIRISSSTNTVYGSIKYRRAIL